MSEKYLISIAVGPVQDFIASARRSRDLWFGSHLLSELSKVVAKEIGKDNLIFPAITDDSQLDENSDFNVVNKILAIVEIPDKKAFDTKLRRVINERLEAIFKDNGNSKGIFDDIDRKLDKDKSFFYRNEAEAQIKDLTELYWAAVPYDEKKYDECRNRVEILLNARKATRDFNRVTWGSNAPKSSLDGQRESVIEDSAIDDVKIQKIFNLRNKERLCGVGVLKRLGAKDLAGSFLSTSHIASLSFLNKVGTAEFEKYSKEIENIAEKESGFNRNDGQIIYRERLKDFIPAEKLDEAKQKLDNFLNRKKPNPYFALLQADGDRMGTVIDKQPDKDHHKRLSEALSKFAGDVKIIVENHKGCLIYSGGDDVLAMLPLHKVLDCTRVLADKFAEDLSNFKDSTNNSPTLSAGIAVVHHTEPLQESLETMRRAEKEAKSVKGKNALAIISSKRSGADTTIKGSWTNDRKTGASFDARLKRFIQLHLDEALPDGAAYQLRDLWLRFRDDTNKKSKVIPGYEKLVEKEAIRILKRKDAKNPIVKEIEKLIENKDVSLDDLAHEIIVARDFKRAYKQAGITKII